MRHRQGQQNMCEEDMLNLLRLVVTKPFALEMKLKSAIYFSTIQI